MLPEFFDADTGAHKMGSGKTECDAFVALLDMVYKDNIFGCDSAEEEEAKDSGITSCRKHMWYFPGFMALVQNGPFGHNKRAGLDMEVFNLTWKSLTSCLILPNIKTENMDKRLVGKNKPKWMLHNENEIRQEA